ncbi:NADH-quinone oxidoreductase subunit M [Candidatus Providencia siddallii]|uniref:NADH-quinone oxidoreductase subunit M n=1 Tax=Candidatus Providencia siddallii TaxID=1715285 RepID=A0ABP1CGM1_9GAMM
MILVNLLLICFFGGLLSWQVGIFNRNISRWVSIISTILLFIFSIHLLYKNNFILFNLNKTQKWKEIFFLNWIPSLGINIHFAVDGLSILMIILTSIASIFAVLSSWNENKKNQGFYYFNLMWITTGIIGVFISVDLFLFFFFWEMMLIPMYFIIINFKNKDLKDKKNINVAMKFFIYTQMSGFIMLLSIVGLVLAHFKTSGILTFNYNDLLNTKMSSTLSFILMLGFFIAFAVKMPLIPFHGWMPDIQEYSPKSGSFDILGIMLKTGAYGMFRFILPLFPKSSDLFAPIVMVIGTISIFYGAILAFRQNNIKRLIAYGNLSHMGFIVIAIFSNSILAYQGAVIQMIANSLSGIGLIIISGLLYDRIKTSDIQMMGGLWKHIKWLPVLTLFFSVANFGIPGTANFIGEFMILFGNFKQFTFLTCIIAFGIIFTSIYSLCMMQQIYYGVSKLKIEVKKLSIREFSMLLILAILIFIIGFYVQPIIDISISSLKTLYNLHSFLLN